MIAPNPVHTTNSAALTTPSWSQLVRGSPSTSEVCVSFGEVMLPLRAAWVDGPLRPVALRMSPEGYHPGRGAGGSG